MSTQKEYLNVIYQDSNIKKESVDNNINNVLTMLFVDSVRNFLKAKNPNLPEFIENKENVKQLKESHFYIPINLLLEDIESNGKPKGGQNVRDVYLNYRQDYDQSSYM